MVAWQQARENGRVTRGAVPEDGIQRLLVSQFVIEKRMGLHEIPSEGIDEYAQADRLFLHNGIPLR